MTGIADLLQRYSGASPENAPASVNQDFSQVAQTASSDHLGGGLSHAFRSDQTPPFENMVANLFGASNGDQKAGILNQLLSSIAPGALSGGILGEVSKYLGAGRSSTAITPQQAEQVSPEAVQELARNAKQQDPSIVDRASTFYAEHPTLVQALGAGALAMIMSHMSNRS
jgi:hypothetical protein